MKKSKLDPSDYKSWGVEKYGYYLIVNSDPELYLGDEVIIDVENYTDGRFAGLGVLVPGEHALYFWNTLTVKLKGVLRNKMLIGHVLRTDIHKLVGWGFEIDTTRTHYDTALIEHLSDSTKKKYGLKHLAKTKFGIEYPSYEEIVGEGDFDKVPTEVIANYNGMDLVATAKLYESQDHNLMNIDIYKRLIWPLGDVINDMEEKGLKINSDKLRGYGDLITDLHSKVSTRLRNELGNINFNSSQQKLEALAKKGICPTHKGKASTNRKGLELQRKTPLLDDLLQYSELQKLLSSYVTPYMETKTEVIHSFFSQTRTRTGRLSSSNPNVQQVPKHGGYAKQFQSIFEARPGYIMAELDYSAIEPRFLAHYSKSRNLCALFRSGVNFHEYTMTQMNLPKEKAKVYNLSCGYRITKYGLAYQLRCSPEEAAQGQNQWWGQWPDLMLWENNLIALTKQKGYIETLLGRKIYIDNLDSNDYKLRATAERRVIENLAQGSVSELIGLAMIELHKAGFTIINQVHDSVLLEVKEDNYQLEVEQACEIMENVLVLEVPIIVEAKIGDNWGEMQKWSTKQKTAA